MAKTARTRSPYGSPPDKLSHLRGEDWPSPTGVTPIEEAGLAPAMKGSDASLVTSSTEGPAPLRVFPDYCADPVWNDTGMADLDALQVPEWLQGELRDWARDWEDLMGVRELRYAVVDERAHRLWHRRGRKLAQQLQSEVGDAYRVEYRE